MSFETRPNAVLDYQSVSYPGSMAEFRGPPADLMQKQVLCLGGTETFGRFVEHPFPALMAARLGRPVANLGVMNAGLELFLNDSAIQRAIQHADHVVLQITGAHLMTNRFYRVHPRRNDRFLRASSALSTVYRGTDFTEFHFVRHMLSVLAVESAERFAIVMRELQEAWVARMKTLITQIDGPVHLLWMSTNPPLDALQSLEEGSDPLFITDAMVKDVVQVANSLTVCTSNEAEIALPTEGKVFAPRESAAAKLLPGPAQHDRAADMLAELIGN